MKFVILVTLAVVAVAQAKFLMSPNTLSAAMEKNTIDEEPVSQAATQTESLYIPMARYVSCNNSGCVAVCHALGYKYGRCINDSTCQCYN